MLSCLPDDQYDYELTCEVHWSQRNVGEKILAYLFAFFLEMFTVSHFVTVSSRSKPASEHDCCDAFRCRAEEIRSSSAHLMLCCAECLDVSIFDYMTVYVHRSVLLPTQDSSVFDCIFT